MEEDKLLRNACCEYRYCMCHLTAGIPSANLVIRCICCCPDNHKWQPCCAQECLVGLEKQEEII